MAPSSNHRKKLSAADLEKLKTTVLARKEALAKSRSAQLEKQSSIFRKLPGKMLWWFCLCTSIFSAVFLVDGWLEQKYTEFEIHSSTEDIVNVVSGGWEVGATFNWVFLDEDQKLGVHMYKGEFEKANISGLLSLGRSPIFKVPYSFKIKESNGETYIKNLQFNYGYIIVLPLFLLLVCTVWLFVNPSTDYQWIMFGYFNMTVTTTAMIFLMLRVMEYFNSVGMYEIDFRGLVLPS